jgi:hypothetical protein
MDKIKGAAKGAVSLVKDAGKLAYKASPVGMTVDAVKGATHFVKNAKENGFKAAAKDAVKDTGTYVKNRAKAGIAFAKDHPNATMMAASMLVPELQLSNMAMKGMRMARGAEAAEIGAANAGRAAKAVGKVAEKEKLFGPGSVKTGNRGMLARASEMGEQASSKVSKAMSNASSKVKGAFARTPKGPGEIEMTNMKGNLSKSSSSLVPRKASAPVSLSGPASSSSSALVLRKPTSTALVRDVEGLAPQYAPPGVPKPKMSSALVKSGSIPPQYMAPKAGNSSFGKVSKKRLLSTSEAPLPKRVLDESGLILFQIYFH